MGMQTDVLASKLRTNAGQLVDQSDNDIGRARVKAIYIVPNSTAGEVVFRDGGASGPIKITVQTIASATTPDYILIPGEGLLFQTNIYIAPSGVLSTMVVYA